MDTVVDKESITLPKVYFTQDACRQLSLIVDNDFTLAGKYFRILISGKGCDGFEYSIGFTDLHQDDLTVPIMSEEAFDHHVIMDPFTAFYLQDTHVDYKQDFANNDEGFVVTNKNQKNYNGKFWKQNPGFVPPTV